MATIFPGEERPDINGTEKIMSTKGEGNDSSAFVYLSKLKKWILGNVDLSNELANKATKPLSSLEDPDIGKNSMLSYQNQDGSERSLTFESLCSAIPQDTPIKASINIPNLNVIIARKTNTIVEDLDKTRIEGTRPGVAFSSAYSDGNCDIFISHLFDPNMEFLKHEPVIAVLRKRKTHKRGRERERTRKVKWVDCGLGEHTVNNEYNPWDRILADYRRPISSRFIATNSKYHLDFDSNSLLNQFILYQRPLDDPDGIAGQLKLTANFGKGGAYIPAVEPPNNPTPVKCTLGLAIRITNPAWKESFPETAVEWSGIRKYIYGPITELEGNVSAICTYEPLQFANFTLRKGLTVR